MLFKVTTNDIREDNDNIDAVPEFVPCSSRELKYIFLTYDYDTPLKQLEYDKRRERAAEMAGYKMETGKAKRLDKTGRNLLNGKYPHVEAAIERFKGIRRDIDREVLESYNMQLEQFIEKAASPKKDNKDWDIAIKINKELPKLLSQRKEIMDTLNLRADFADNQEEEEVKRNLSTLDQFNQSQIDGK
jgi:hypothetical protein